MYLRNLLLGGTSPHAVFSMEGEGSPAPDAPGPSMPADTSRINAREGGNLITEWRNKQAQKATEKPADKTPAQRAPDGKFAATPPQSTLEGDDAGPEKVPSETVEADPAEVPSIEPPRSWSKEDKELFNALPRETQERVSERERARESDFLRRQNEAADKSKALEAKEQAAEQARQQYESAAQNALQVLQQQQASEFADIKTHADVQRLATDDPFRFAQWQARQMQIQAQAQEVQQLNQQREQEKAESFKTWSKEQDSKFDKMFPEFTDKAKATKNREEILGYLKEVGVPEDTIPKLWNEPFFRDAMFQRVIWDATRMHVARQNAKAAVPEKAPPVQRPGTTPQKGGQFTEAIADAQSRLKGAKGIAAITAAADLMAAQRKAAARR